MSVAAAHTAELPHVPALPPPIRRRAGRGACVPLALTPPVGFPFRDYEEERGAEGLGQQATSFPLPFLPRPRPAPSDSSFRLLFQIHY